MSRVRRLQALVLAGSALLLAGCEHATRLPRDISTHGESIDHLFWLIMWLTGITFVGTQALLVYSIVKFRHREGQRSKHTHGNHLVEMVWTIVPGIILFFLAIYQIPAWKKAKMDEPKDPDCEHVRILGKQFEWAFQYRGEDNTWDTDDDVYKLGEMHIPVNKPVKFYLRSVDVLHSFYMPNLRFKQDLVPGKEIIQWVTATETTKFARAWRAKDDPDGWRDYNYEIACAELCGDNHQKMRGVLVVDTEEDYQAWLKERAEAGEAPPAAFQGSGDNDGWRLALTTDDPARLYRQAGRGEKGFVEKKESKGN